MQDYRLDPQTRARLRQFARRRRRLILLRGACGVVISLLGAMLILVAVDWLFLMPDWLRWTLSFSGYGLALGTVWLSCGRWIVRVPSELQLARLMEAEAPQLREDLVSAVELGSPQADARYDSPVFRSLLQLQVARQLRQLRVGQLLPWSLVRSWSIAAAVLIGVCLLLSRVPEAHFSHRVRRVMLPLANLERLSRVQVTILQPAEGNLMVPHGEPVTIVCALAGPPVKHIVLETRSAAQPRLRVEMRHQADRRFAATVQVAEESVEWRVLAGDAVTRFFRIQTRPRPYAAQFEKTYQYPSYTGLPPQSVVEKHGDLQATEGTVARILIRPDQPIASGHLLLRFGQQEEQVPLQATGDGRLSAELTIAQSGTYQVQLVAAETGFDSRFAPRYQITARPDVAPAVKVTQPRGALLVASDDILTIVGVAEDDLPLAGVEQWVQVNGGEWSRVNIPDAVSQRVDIRRDWDLLDLKLVGGDQVQMKLVATDRKGQVSESAPLRLTVQPGGLDARGLALLAAKQKAALALQRFAELADGHGKRGKESLKILREKNPGPAERQLHAAQVLQAAERLAAEAPVARAAVLEALQQVDAGLDAHDLALGALAVLPVERRLARKVTLHIAEAQRTTEDKDRQRELDRAREMFDRALGCANEADRWLAAVTATDALAVCLEEWHDLIAQQLRTVPGGERVPDSEPAWKMLGRRQAAVSAACELLDSRARPTLERLGNGRVNEALNAITNARKAHEPLLKETPPTAKLIESAHRLTQSLQKARASARPAFQENADRLGKSRPGVYSATIGSAARQLSGAAAAVQLLYPPRSERAPDVEAARRELAAAEWPALTGSLRDIARIEETRRGGDRQYAADMDAAARVANGVLGRVVDATAAAADADTSNDPRRQWSALVEIAAVLETCHNLTELIGTVRRIVEQEKWFATEPMLATRQICEWDFVVDRLVPVADALAAHAGQRPVKEVVDRLKRLAQAPYTVAVTQEMDRRAATADERSKIQDSLALVEQELRDIQQLLRPEEESARLSLQGLAPSISEEMRQLAAETRQQQEQTAALARQAADSSAAETQPAAQQQREQHRALAEDLQQVLDTLRRLANLQNPLDPQQRELAHDVDNATAMLQQEADEIAEALRKASQAAAPEDQSSNLAEAAGSQEQLAGSLNEMADHFERALAGEDVAESREALRQAEQQFARDPSLDAMQQSLQQLAALGELSPQALLEQLERELQRNRPMQRELDDITRQTLQQAQLDLRRDAQTERDSAERLELADAQTAKANDPLLEQLKRIAERSRELADKEIPTLAKDGRPATSGRLDEPLNLATADLRSAADQAGQAADPQLSSTVRMRRALPLAQTLDQSADDLDEAALRARSVKEQMDAKRTAHATATTEVEVAKKTVAETAQKSTEAQRQAQQATDDRQRKRREADALQSQAAQASRQAAAKTQDAALAKAAAEAKQKADAGQQAARTAEQTMQQAVAAANQAKQAARTAQQQLDNNQRRLRSAQPPTTQEVQRESGSEAIRVRVENTAAEARKLAEEARKIGEAAEQLARAAAPPSEAMQQAAEQQAPLAENVASTSQDLARASRHERRLQNEGAGQSIEQLAETVADTADQELPEVAEQVRPLTMASDARTPLERAAGTLDQEAASIDSLLGSEGAPPNAEAAVPGDPSGKPAGNAPSPSATAASQSESTAAPQGPTLADPQTARWLARTLDSLDRMLFDGNTGTPPPADASSLASSDAAAALAAALQAQGDSLQAARTAAAQGQQMQPGSQPTSQARSLATTGASVEAGEIAAGDLPAALPLDNADWGRLPPNQMRDLIEGRREAVSDEYRRMVEAYYRALAEKAGGARKP